MERTIKDLNPNPKNPRKISKEKLAMLKKSMDEFGDLGAVVFNVTTSQLIGGHQRVRILSKAAKITIEHRYDVPTRAGTVAEGFIEQDGERYRYREVQWDETKEKAANIAANKGAGEWDLPSLTDWMQELKLANFDLDLTMFDDAERLPFFEIEKTEGLCDEEETPEPPKEAKTVKGDIWILGNHRLMCGDSTVITDVERLMNGEKADLLWTDPPYGVSYTDKNEYLNGLGAGHRLTKPIENDHKTPAEMNDFWFSFLSCAHIVLADKSSYYIASPQGGDLMMMMMSIIRAGFQLKHMLIWVKNNHVLGRCDYNYKHEPILYGWKESGTHEFYGNGRCKTSVWDFNKPLKNDLHPTMKPVELIEEAILNSTQSGHIVLDLFGGSGSTMIASEKSGRRCFMMELDTGYNDVILTRWAKFTGKDPIRESDGQKWSIVSNQ